MVLAWWLLLFGGGGRAYTTAEVLPIQLTVAVNCFTWCYLPSPPCNVQIINSVRGAFFVFVSIAGQIDGRRCGSIK